MRFQKIKLVLLLIVFLTVRPLWSEPIKITEYKFSITGKTKEAALRNFLIPKGEEIFESEDDLKENLGRKKQALVNKRIFSDVQCEYSLGEPEKGFVPCTAKFSVQDSFTILVFPYPKYDSNYGFKIGLKAYDKNLWGTFGNLSFVTGVSQNEQTFKKASVYALLALDNLNLKWANLGLNAEFLLDLSSFPNSYFQFGLQAKNIMLGPVRLGLSPWFKINPKTDGKSWVLGEIGNETTIGPFLEEKGGFELFNRISVRPEDKVLKSLSYLCWGPGGKISVKISALTQSLDNMGKVSSLRLGPTFGIYLKLFNWADFSNEFSEYNNWDFESSSFRPSLEWDSALSKTSLDWFGDFRKGLQFGIASQAELFLERGKPFGELFRWGVEAQLKWFPFALSWFNPSVRFSGSFANYEPEFQSSNIRFSFGDYIRGVRLKNINVQNASQSKALLAVNLDLNMKFIKFGNFARSYVSPFFDLAFAGGHLLTGVGADCILILAKFPSFPIRASVGFNFDDLIKKLKGQLPGFPEYELYLGLDFFY